MTGAVRRLLYVVHYPVFGGQHNQAIQLDHALRERQWDQVVLLPEEPGNGVPRLREAGVDVCTAPLGRLRAKPDVRLQLGFFRSFWPDVRRIRSLIRELDAQTVMIAGLVNPHAAVAARMEGVPLVWQILDTRAPMALRRALMPLVLHLADSVLCTGSLVARQHPGAERLGERLITYFPPVDTGAFVASAERRAKARTELGLAADDVVVGTVGNLNPQKGHATFVSAAAQLKERCPDVRFVILGACYPHHKAYEDGLWKQASALGLHRGRDLILRDPGDRVHLLAQALDIFWLTSEPRSEGIPTVVEEAMSLALPVVSADVGAVREAVEDGRSGFLVPPTAPERLASTTERLVADRSLRETVGAEARERAVAQFGVDRCADVHVQALEVARRRAQRRTRDTRLVLSRLLSRPQRDG